MLLFLMLFCVSRWRPLRSLSRRIHRGDLLSRPRLSLQKGIQQRLELFQVNRLRHMAIHAL